MTVAHTAHGPAATHDQAPEVVAQRQVLGVWLFIAGDAVIIGSLLFTYLYLRGLNTQQQWMPAGVHGASTVLSWVTLAVAVLSALGLRSAERSVSRGASNAIALFLLASALALVGAGFSIVALGKIPRYVNAVSGVKQIAGSYASALMAIEVSNVVHLVLLALLGIGVAVRVAKGRISAAAWTHARLVRIFWVWVVSAMTLSAVITTVFVGSPR